MIGWQRYQAQELVQSLAVDQWQQISCGMGSKEKRYYDWTRRLAVNCDSSRGFQRWLLFRRFLEHPDDPRFISYYQVFAPSQTSLETMVQIAGQRWRIQECFRFAKDQLGLKEYEVPCWHGWHRHITLVLAAQSFLSVLRYLAEPVINPTTPTPVLTPATTRTMTAIIAARG